jgi:hypothetical protein
MPIETIRFAAHVVHLHPVGIGCLIRPRPANDPTWTTMGREPIAASGWSLEASDWDAAMKWLGERGWEPVEADWENPSYDGGMVSLGVTADGLDVVSLGRRGAMAELGEVVAAEAELLEAAGL